MELPLRVGPNAQPIAHLTDLRQRRQLGHIPQSECPQSRSSVRVQKSQQNDSWSDVSFIGTGSCCALVGVALLSRRQHRALAKRRQRIVARGAGFAVADTVNASTDEQDYENLSGTVHDQMPEVLTQIQHAEDQTIVYSEEPEFRQWLKKRGCVGVENVEIVAGGGTGIWLRSGIADAASGTQILVVPRDAWLAVSMEQDDPEVELAWRLISEHWQGAASPYAPYIDFLWQNNLSLHPLFWDVEESDWLQASVETYEALCEMRDTMDARLRILRKRALSFTSEIPDALASSRTLLDEQIRFALCLVESRAIEASPPSADEPTVAALVPLLDHFCHDGTGRESCEVGEEDGANCPMVCVATRDIEAGEQLKHCFEPLSTAELFVQYGFVLNATNMEEAVKANIHHTVTLPIWVAPELFRQGSVSSVPLKQLNLAERAGLDTRKSRKTASEDSARLTLPKDLSGLRGRMLPCARYLVASVTPAMGETEELAVARLFDKHFKGRLPNEQCPPKAWCPIAQDLLSLEVVSRAIAWQWCNKLVKRYEKAAKTIYAEIGGSESVDEPGEEDEANDDDDDDDDDEDIVIDSVVNAFYKAKGPKGTKVKSRRPKEARVLALEGDVAVVQFLANGVRHNVPKDWIVVEGGDSPKAEPVAKAPASDLRVARGKMALQLLQTEASVVQLAYDVTSSFVRIGHDLMEAREKSDYNGQVKAEKELQEVWDDQQKHNFG